MTKQQLLDVLNKKLKYFIKASKMNANKLEDDKSNFDFNVDDTDEIVKELQFEELKIKFSKDSYVGFGDMEENEYRFYIHERYILALRFLIEKIKRMSSSNFEVEPNQRVDRYNQFKKVFISYSTIDKAIAGKLKLLFEGHGFEVFVAHDDINHGKIWDDKIEAELKDMDIFIPLYSKNFGKSDWTYQECGAALMMTNYVYPFTIDGVKARGFINKYQAKQLDLDYPEQTFAEMIDEMLSLKNTAWRDRLIDFMKTEDFFEIMHVGVIKLLGCFEYDKISINNLLGNVTYNENIRSLSDASIIILSGLYKKYKSKLNQDLFNRFKLKMENPDMFFYGDEQTNPIHGETIVSQFLKHVKSKKDTEKD